MSAGAGVIKTKKMIKSILFLTAAGCTAYLAFRTIKPFLKKEDPRLKDWLKEQKRKQ